MMQIRRLAVNILPFVDRYKCRSDDNVHSLTNIKNLRC